jgi:hypothetical protein
VTADWTGTSREIDVLPTPGEPITLRAGDVFRPVMAGDARQADAVDVAATAALRRGRREASRR